MTDRHQAPARTFRPPPEVYETAQRNLAKLDTDWSMSDLLTAALVVFNTNPAGILKRFAREHTPGRKGRPPKPKDGKRSS
jgi:hypothetical protein